MNNLKRKKSLCLVILIFASVFTTITTLDASEVKYEYDDLNRLTRAIYDETTVIEYTYDEVGNRIWRIATLMADTFVDGEVDFHDFAIVASHWLYEECGYADEWCQRADINWNSEVGFDDLAFIAQQWLDSVD